MLDYADLDGTIWMDGQMIPWRDAKVHFLTHSLQYGSLIFEGERAYDGRIFKLREHTERMFTGAELLGYHVPYTREVIDQACNDVLAANGLVDGYVRPATWRGSEKLGLSPVGALVHVAIAAWAWPSYFTPEQRMAGVRLTQSRWRRPAPDTAPTQAKASGLYQICSMAKQEAEEQGFADALMLDYRGLLAEATGANLFFVIDGKLHTPTPDCFLNGITRQTVIGLARDAGIEVVERHIAVEELGTVTEAFLTGTAIEITPISEIDSFRFKPGAVCARMIADYTRLIRAPQ